MHAHLSVDAAFDHALNAADARDRALLPVARVAYGQPFIRDCAPHELCVRASQVAMVDDDEVPVVVIACEQFDGNATSSHPVGRVFGMPRHHTVRKVAVLKPLVGKAHA